MTTSQKSTPDRDSNRGYPEGVLTLRLPDRQVVLVGTAHVSRASADLVKRVISGEKPDRVCVELDKKRYRALVGRHKWESLDLKEVIRNRQLATLLANLVLASYQKKLGGQLGIMPGAELLVAVECAEELQIPVSLCDRDIRVTLRRAWRATPWYRKTYLLAAVLASLFDRTELTEEKLAELQQKDVLSELLAELGRSMPELKTALIDERDIYLAERIKSVEGRHLVAVVGAGHLAGISEKILQDNRRRLPGISSFPPVSPLYRMIGWSVPAVIVAALITIGIRKGMSAAGANLLYWILANGIPTAAGAALARGHPLTVAGGFVAAPLTSLTPVIGAGYVTAFIQVMLRPPVVREFETVLADMGTFGGWWRNKLLRVFLAFVLPGLGSMLGTWIGGVKIISNLW